MDVECKEHDRTVGNISTKVSFTGARQSALWRMWAWKKDLESAVVQNFLGSERGYGNPGSATSDGVKDFRNVHKDTFSCV